MSGRDDQTELGRSLRAACPRSAHGEWSAPADRPSIVDIMRAQHEQRIPELVPVRIERMASSAFAFFRGAAKIMAIDLAASPVTGLTVQACGDAHVGNFGLFASPERQLVFDLNDFDETLPGPWEWDLKRLVASVEILGRDRGFPEAVRAQAVAATSAAYRTWMAHYAVMPTLEVFYDRVSADQAVGELHSARRRTIERGLARSRRKTSERMLQKLTVTEDGQPRIVDQPPLITHIDIAGNFEQLQLLYRNYLESLPEERAELVQRYRVVDFARKVVGVGSVGTRCFIALLLDHNDAPLFLQIKEATSSVLEAAPGAGDPGDHEGRRVVVGQRRMQAVSDIFLGYTRVGAIDGYVRQLADMKGGAELEAISDAVLGEYGGLCGWTLARAHARSGDPAAISGYLGTGDQLDRALVIFAQRYADQNAQDHATMLDAVASGALE